MAHYQYDIFETPFGWVGALASSRGLRRTTLPQPTPDLCAEDLGAELEDAELAPERFTELRDKITRHFEGAPVSFEDEPIDVEDAAPFLRAAWAACRSIPPGETRSYGWIAARAGSARAPRAAGQSMARNRLPIIVPCHRVVASDGSLGGFGRGKTGLDLKRRLLELEASAR